MTNRHLLLAALCLLPASAFAHGTCSTSGPLANVSYWASIALSLLLVLLTPLLLSRWLPGKWGLLLSLLDACLGWLHVAALVAGNFVAGMGCPNLWSLIAANASPALTQGLLLAAMWGWQHRRRHAPLLSTAHDDPT